MKQTILFILLLTAMIGNAQVDTTFQIDFKVKKSGKKQTVSQTVTQEDGTTIVTTFPDMDSTQLVQWKRINMDYQDSVSLYVQKEIDRIEQQQAYIEELKKQNQKALKDLKVQANKSARIRQKIMVIK